MRRSAQESGTPPTNAIAASSNPPQCNLAALSELERDRRAQLAAQVRAAIQETRELPTGFEYRLPSDSATLATVEELLMLEQRCCAFLTFALHFESGQRWLRVTGEEGVKEFLRDWLKDD